MWVACGNGFPNGRICKQADVHRFVKDWVDKYKLAPYIRLNCKVTATEWKEDHWAIKTQSGSYQSRYLIAASGVQNEPWTPTVDRRNANLTEHHSSRLEKPEELDNKVVTVVGGGASAFDLLDLALKHNAKKINWIYRSTKWFLPSTKSKQANKLNDLRSLSRIQTIMPSLETVNERFGKILYSKYDYFQLKSIKPVEPLDLHKDQIIPGRSLMIRHFDNIHRHPDEIQAINENEIILKSGERLVSDVLLWGTGYQMNLSYLDLPEFNNITRLKDLKPRLGSLVRSLDYPNMFFLGMSLIESTSATPFFAAIESKSIVAHILGKCEIPRKKIPYHVVHWDLIKFFGSFYHGFFTRFLWKLKYYLKPWWYSIFPGKQVKI